MHAQEKAPYFIVEGNIGAGKSTFLKILEHYLNVQIVYEPLEKWQNVAGENLLYKFYADTKRWAYTFQSYAFITRVLEQEKQALVNTRPVQIVERSVYSDRYCFAQNAFEMGLMTSLEWKLYQEWFAWLIDTYMTKPKGFIYLRTDPKICYERLLKRNRSEETAISLSYLTALHEKHESWLLEKHEVAQHLKEVPVLVLECNQEFEADRVVQKKHIENIIQFFQVEYAIPAAISSRQASLL